MIEVVDAEAWGICVKEEIQVFHTFEAMAADTGPDDAGVGQASQEALWEILWLEAPPDRIVRRWRPLGHPRPLEHDQVVADAVAGIDDVDGPGDCVPVVDRDDSGHFDELVKRGDGFLQASVHDDGARS